MKSVLPVALLFCGCAADGKAWPSQGDGSYPILGRLHGTTAFFANGADLQSALGPADIAVEELEWPPGARDVPSERTTIYYVLSGQGRFRVGTESQTVTAGHFMLVRAGESAEALPADAPLRVLAMTTLLEVAVAPEASRFLHENQATWRATKSHPPWLRGTGKNGLAAEDANYHYTMPVGKNVESGWHSDRLALGSNHFLPGIMYPAHNHPSPEIYYVVSGETEWWVDDEWQVIGPGTFILDRPFAVHGWINRSPSAELKLIWIWWADRAVSADMLDRPALFSNPELARDPKTARLHAVPIPKPR